jgi:tRNA pseudouridine38-40 synthase
MARYFIELSYDGASFGGFQIQQNVGTVQGALENAMETLFRAPISLTGASRTDAGVHAYQNFLHFDTELEVLPKHVYNLNAILPNSVVVKGIYAVPNEAHSRFDFESFSKKNTQVNSFQCAITKANWTMSGSDIQFEIHSNRFLRGMIRGLVGTMVQVGRGQISIQEWHEIVASKDEQRVDFSTPACGLYLSQIIYPDFLKKIG